MKGKKGYVRDSLALVWHRPKQHWEGRTCCSVSAADEMAVNTPLSEINREGEEEGRTTMMKENKEHLHVVLEVPLRVRRISKDVLPKRGSAKAAGYDISSAEENVVPAKGTYIDRT